MTGVYLYIKTVLKLILYINTVHSLIVIPVHGELGHQCDVCVVLGGRVLVLQEVQMHSMYCQTLSPEVVTLIVLVELLQSRLQLKRCTARKFLSLKFLFYQTHLVESQMS